MPAVPPVLVVIVTWNSSAVLPELLESLPAGLAGIDWRVVVADNDSHDGTAEIAERSPHVEQVVRTGRNAGYAAGVNAGAARALADEAVLVLNPDVRVGHGAGAAMVKALATPGTGIVVPRQLSTDGELLRTLRRDPTPLRVWGEALLGGLRAGRVAAFGEVVVDDDAYSRNDTADWATGSVMLVSAECRAATGPWDESFFLYSEETEYAQRARRLGFALRLCPEAEVMHHRGDSHVSAPLWSLLVRNRYRLYSRNASALSRSVFYLGLLVGELLRSPRSTTHRAAVRELLGLKRAPLPGT